MKQEQQTVIQVRQDSAITHKVSLPALAQLPKGIQKLREHRKRHPAPFDNIKRHKDGITRYYSDVSAVCVGEWVISQFTPLENQWVLLYPLDADEATSSDSPLLWYALHVKSGRVQREHLDNIEVLLTQFAFECVKSEAVYLPKSANINIGADSEEKRKPAPFLSVKSQYLQALPNKYLTQSLERWHRPALISVVCLCLTGLGTWLMLINNPPQITLTQAVDPFEAWSQQLNQTPLAETALRQSQKMLSNARLLPNGYQAKTLTLGGNTLSLEILSTLSSPNRNTFNRWHQRYWQHKQAAKKIVWNGSRAVLHTTLYLPPDDMTMSVLGRYPEKLYEQLRLLGIDELVLNQASAVGQIENWTLSGKVTSSNIATLGNIAYLTQKKPVFIQNLTVTPNLENEVDMAFTLALLGVTP